MPSAGGLRPHTKELPLPALSMRKSPTYRVSEATNLTAHPQAHWPHTAFAAWRSGNRLGRFAFRRATQPGTQGHEDQLTTGPVRRTRRAHEVGRFARMRCSVTEPGSSPRSTCFTSPGSDDRLGQGLPQLLHRREAAGQLNGLGPELFPGSWWTRTVYTSSFIARRPSRRRRV